MPYGVPGIDVEGVDRPEPIRGLLAIEKLSGRGGLAGGASSSSIKAASRPCGEDAIWGMEF